MDLSFLDDSTLWVGISFLLFVLLIIKPAISGLSKTVDSQIDSLKKNLEESKKLMFDAKALFEEHKIKEKENIKNISELKSQAINDAKIIEKKMKEEINLAIKRKEANFKIIIKQMEENLKDEIQEEIMKKTVEFTELRIKNNISKNHDDKFIKESLKKIPKQLS